MNVRINFSLTLAAVFLGSLGAAAVAKGVLPASQVAVVTTTGNALVIWDASVFINQMAVDKVPSNSGMAQIESTAGRLLIEKAKSFRPAAKTVTVKVLYASTQLAEVYKTATFDGFQKLVLVSASRGDAVAQTDGWLRTLGQNRLPAGMTAKVVGALPKS
jgi:hypothetical protein